MAALRRRRLFRRDSIGSPVRLFLQRGAGAPLPPPGPAPPPPRGPRQAPRRGRGRGGELRVRAVGGGRRERHPRADGLRPREAGEDLRRRGRRRVLRQPHRPARGEGRAHRRDRQVVRAAAARRQLPQRRRRQLPRVHRAADRRRVRERLQLAHRHRGRHRHLRRAARVAGPRADRAARPEDDRRQERPPQDAARPGAHRRLHRAVRPRRLQLDRHERPEADRGDRVRVRVARRPARSLRPA
uniref:Uncharacterized protein n=1 Tax=Zea mays TaxID=4577 RepID=B4FRS7_MAIZE|nr:unknown [Zea mays]